MKNDINIILEKLRKLKNRILNYESNYQNPSLKDHIFNQFTSFIKENPTIIKIESRFNYIEIYITKDNKDATNFKGINIKCYINHPTLEFEIYTGKFINEKLEGKGNIRQIFKDHPRDISEIHQTGEFKNGILDKEVYFFIEHTKNNTRKCTYSLIQVNYKDGIQTGPCRTDYEYENHQLDIKTLTFIGEANDNIASSDIRIQIETNTGALLECKLDHTTNKIFLLLNNKEIYMGIYDNETDKFWEAAVIRTLSNLLQKVSSYRDKKRKEIHHKSYLPLKKQKHP